MSDTATPVFRRISHTPMRDVLRGRITGRLDWKRRVATSGLPPAAAHLIVSVVTRTRLLRLEKAAVADELLAHFQDGDEAGATAEELLDSFGDQTTAARLIRRAKQRARPFPWHPWHLWRISRCATAVLAVVYGLMLLRFCLSHPSPSVDYLAMVNEPVRQTPPTDRAWPLWREAILACGQMDSGHMNGGQMNGGSIPLMPANEAPWPDIVAWLGQHAGGLAMARQAAAKPVLGFDLGPGGSTQDPRLPFTQYRDVPNEPLCMVLRPREYGHYLSRMSLALSFDARRAAEAGDPATAEADVSAMFGLAGQLQYSDGLLDSQMFALAVRDSAIARIQYLLVKLPGSLPDEALIRLANAISGPEVAGDLVSLKRERLCFLDALQRLYTDDGQGDGHATMDGWRALNRTIAAMPGNRVETNPLLYPAGRVAGGTELASTVPLLTASRAELLAMYDRLMDQQEADLRLPLRQVDMNRTRSKLNQLAASPVDRIRYGLLIQTMPVVSRTPAACERYLGMRDGTEIGIALELYRRRHGSYPAVLAELAPEIVPAIPADRITGEPVKYRLIDGKPVVYSVGADRVDNGGTPPSDDLAQPNPASWGDEPANPVKGDWLLFSPRLIDGIK